MNKPVRCRKFYFREYYSKEPLFGDITWQYFKSITEASLKTEILVTAISNALRGKSKSAGGFKWEYVINQHPPRRQEKEG